MIASRDMNDTPRKKLTLTRKPKPVTGTSADDTADDQAAKPVQTVKRAGKRRIIRNEAAKPVAPNKPKPKPADKRKKGPPRKNKKKALVSPSDLKAQALDQRLKSFDVWSTYKPLSIGIDKEVFRLVNGEAFPGASKKVVQKLLRMHTGHSRYLQAVSRGGSRYTLDGEPAETITSYQQQLAVEMQARRGGRNLPG